VEENYSIKPERIVQFTMNKLGKILVLGVGVILIAGYFLVVVSLDFLNPVERQMKKDMRERAELPSEPFLQDITPLKDWYAHRISDNYILLTRQEELPDVGATEGYAYGEQIGINLIKSDMSPEEWVAQKVFIDLDDVLVLSKEWSTYNGQKLLTVEHEVAGAGGKMLTEYLFAGDLIYIVFLYPLEIYDDASGAYVRNKEGVQDLGRVIYRLLPQILAQESVRRQLAENCARDIPREKIDDISFDPENKVVQFYWWDIETNDNVHTIVPYEPETGFAGCSESVKDLLRHLPNPYDDE